MSSYKRKLEHQLYLARENPEPVFDLNDCDLKAVPSGVYSICKVLQKQRLILSKNKLENLDGGGKLQDLFTIRELDLSSNKFKQLPVEFATSLRSLQKLNLSDNQIVNLPSNISDMGELEVIDLRSNPKLGRLSESLLSCPKLKSVVLDKSHPDFSAFSNLPQNERRGSTSKQIATPELYPRLSGQSNTVNSVAKDEVDAQDTTQAAFLRYERDREVKRRALIDSEAERLGNDLNNSLKLDYAARDRQRASLVRELLVEDQRANAEMCKLIDAKRDERARFFSSIAQEEATVRKLIDGILATNEAARRAEQLLADADERAFYANAALIADVRVRRDEVVNRMRAELERSEQLAELLEKRSRREQADVLRVAMSHAERESNAVDAALSQRDRTHAQLVNTLIEDQEVQKSMFEELQLARDTTRRRLVDEIALVERELLKLSLLDAERRQLSDDTQRRVLERQREELVALLRELLNEKARRETQLRALLVEMEAQRTIEQVDFWLVQYQRLLDATPDALLSKMFELDQVIVDILFNANAEDYIPQFKRHRITAPHFLEITDAELKSLGVSLVGTRKSILTQIERYLTTRKEKTAPESEKPPAALPSTAPPMSAQAEVELGASDTVLRVGAECCVCLDARCDTVFLNCGHVCTCRQCAAPLSACPLCRQSINQKLPLQFTL